MAMRTVSFKLPEQLDDSLDELAKSRNTSRSALAREALEALVARPRLSVAAAVVASVELVDGPSDLSTSAKHLDGYGR